MDRGQKFIADIISMLMANEQRWPNTLLVIIYDEHGGLFDHVAPPPLTTQCDPHAPFNTLGVRVPAMFVSPLVEPGVCIRPSSQAAFDHVSVLKFIVQKFKSVDDPFSALVESRAVGSLSECLTRDDPHPGPWTRPPNVAVSSLPHVPPEAGPLLSPFSDAAHTLEDWVGRDEALQRYPGFAALLGHAD